MSLLMLKTKNLSWQDHTLNIEAMLAPTRSTLLLNKHKTLDTKLEKERSLFTRQKDACIKDFIVEERLIKRRRQKIINRKRQLIDEARAKSALDTSLDENEEPQNSTGQGRSLSAPVDGRTKPESDELKEQQPVSTLPKLTLRQTPLFGGTFLRPRLFLETGYRPSSPDSDKSNAKTTSSAVSSALVTDRKLKSKPPKGKSTEKLPTTLPPTQEKRKPVKVTPNTTEINRFTVPTPKRIPNVKFLEFLNDADDLEDTKPVEIEIKQKTIEDKVRDFIRELDTFNSRPPTACSSGIDDSVFSFRSKESAPLVANKYNTFTLDKKLLEKAFDRYCDKRSHEELLKAMKLAAKMKAHIRQSRNTSLVPTMASFKSSRTFMKLLKRQKMQGKQVPGVNAA